MKIYKNVLLTVAISLISLPLLASECHNVFTSQKTLEKVSSSLSGFVKFKVKVSESMNSSENRPIRVVEMERPLSSWIPSVAKKLTSQTAKDSFELRIEIQNALSETYIDQKRAGAQIIDINREELTYKVEKSQGISLYELIKKTGPKEFSKLFGAQINDFRSQFQLSLNQKHKITPDQLHFLDLLIEGVMDSKRAKPWGHSLKNVFVTLSPDGRKITQIQIGYL